MTMGNLNLDRYRPISHKFVIKMYLNEILPLYREKYEIRRENGMLRKKKLELNLIKINRKHIARKILQKKMNINCVDNIMAFM